jgi:flagellar basal body-associated protein FliL
MNLGRDGGRRTEEKENKENKNMKKGKAIFFGIIIIVIVALALWLGFVLAGMQSGSANPSAASPYSAVYLTSGDVYFGRLSWFPSPHMTDVWFLERNQSQSGETQLAIAPMKSVFWGPVDEINFNPQEILFWTRLMNSSQVVQSIENPASAAQNGMGAGSLGTAPSTAPSLPAGTSATSTK